MKKKNFEFYEKNTALQLQRKIGVYFTRCDDLNVENSTKLVKPYTISGLCSHLGVSRDEFGKLEKNKCLAQTIIMAKLRIENFIEENVLSGRIAAASAVPTLKYNFGWTDKPLKDAAAEEIVVDFGGLEDFSA